MKNYIDFTALADWYNAMTAGWVLLLTTVFGAHWYLFAVVVFQCGGLADGMVQGKKEQRRKQQNRTARLGEEDLLLAAYCSSIRGSGSIHRIGQ